MMPRSLAHQHQLRPNILDISSNTSLAARDPVTIMFVIRLTGCQRSPYHSVGNRAGNLNDAYLAHIGRRKMYVDDDRVTSR